MHQKGISKRIPTSYVNISMKNTQCFTFGPTKKRCIKRTVIPLTLLLLYTLLTPSAIFIILKPGILIKSKHIGFISFLYSWEFLRIDDNDIDHYVVRFFLLLIKFCNSFHSPCVLCLIPQSHFYVTSLSTFYRLRDKPNLHRWRESLAKVSDSKIYLFLNTWLIFKCPFSFGGLFYTWDICRSIFVQVVNHFLPYYKNFIVFLLYLLIHNNDYNEIFVKSYSDFDLVAMFLKFSSNFLKFFCLIWE